MREYLFILVVAAAVTYLGTPVARRMAERVGAMTAVRDRDVHAVPTPRLGGVAMFAGFAVALVVASRMPFGSKVFEGSHAPYAVLAGAALVCALGIVDDVWGLDAVTKLAGQVLAGGVMAWQGVQLLSLPLGGVTLLSSRVLIALTVLAVVVTINAVNFVDGLDGLAAGIVAIAGAAFFVYSYLLSRDSSPEDVSSLASLVTAAMVGCCLGFLPHNVYPARVFMGDSGAMFLGLVLAASVVSITGQVDPAVVSQQKIVPAFFPLLIMVAVLLVPVADLLLAVVRRTRAGRSPFHPDKMHLHHRLLDLGHSHARAVLIMYVWTGAIAFGATASAFLPLRTTVLVGAVVLVAVILLTLGPALLARLTRQPVPVEPQPVPVEPDDVANADDAGLPGRGTEVAQGQARQTT